MNNININLVNSFEGVLNNLVDGEVYSKLPPRGPRDLAALSNSELKAKELNESGELPADKNYDPSVFKNIQINGIEDSYLPKEVALPGTDLLDGTIICGIDGSNQKIEKNSFYFLLARAAIINFKYTKGNEPPYFYQKRKDASAITEVDGNIFKENVIEFTNNKLRKSDKNESTNILEFLKKDASKPFLVRFDHTKNDKNPSSHALGWAVKLQQALELLCIEEIDPNDRNKTICIKDGPLFSTSSSEYDTIEGLRPVIQWNQQILVGVSKRISDSKLMLETLCSFPELLDIYFPGDEVSKENIESIGTDSLLLQRILKPGYRTPLIKAVPIQRQGVCKRALEELSFDFTPLNCYYRGRTRPQTFIRIEFPFFMWERNPEFVIQALSIVAWQHELGGKAPYIQNVADDLCQLHYEKEMLEKQTLAALSRNKLDLAEQY